jgi:hypothetical protein
MTELDQAAIDLFKAVLKTGRDILGHPEFNFKFDATIGTRAEDAAGGQLLGMRIQEALEIAKKAAAPVTIEGTSVQ